MSEVLEHWLSKFGDIPLAVVALGLVGQAVFMARFLVQWIASEKAGRSVMPVAFWWLSLAGATLLFIYAVLRADPVFILAQTFGSVVYVRNLMLIRETKAPPTSPGT
ncbi:MAG: hypothetical protein DWQ01_02530 [Planctomycetota bacterium]|nr:MAG: hypothetical protein DWQ01_02530 [Planctomycetota bacterium]